MRTKATLFQSLLNQPSQTYYSPHRQQQQQEHPSKSTSAATSTPLLTLTTISATPKSLIKKTRAHIAEDFVENHNLSATRHSLRGAERLLPGEEGDDNDESIEKSIEGTIEETAKHFIAPSEHKREGSHPSHLRSPLSSSSPSLISTQKLQPTSTSSDSDSDSDVFYTPPMSHPALPPSQFFSSASSDGDDLGDSIFSAKSVDTTATSLSLSSPKLRPTSTAVDPLARSASYSGSSRSRPRSRVLPNWSKDVRWLVPPDTVSVSSRSSNSFQGIELIEIEHEAASRNSRTSVRRRTAIGRRRTVSDRMSAVWEEEEDFAEGDQQSQKPRTVSVPANPNARRPRDRDRSSRSSSTSTIPSRTVSLPIPLSVSAGSMGASTGYTSLTLPRASYLSSKRPGRVTSSVDLTRSGIAQTTMSTISIARHKPNDKSKTPDRLLEDPSIHLSFTSHMSPPSKVHSRQVLVKVWTVGLNCIDTLLVADRAERNDGFGYIPGRSFVGRALECGWDVNGISKGDWVFGLLEVKKAGALAEFILVDRRHIHRAPRQSPTFTQEHLALLSLSGVAAHRAVRTLSHLPPGSRAFILNAHAGSGLLVAQLLAARGIAVTAHVPGGWGSSCERRTRMAGATEVRCGEIGEVVEGLEEGKFDAVVDPIGGKKVWDMCQRVLRVSGQFTTLHGDTPHLPVPPPRVHFKSNMRSLRRAFLKQVGYQWVAAGADIDSSGEDVRDSLAAVGRLAEEGVLRPFVGETYVAETAESGSGDDDDADAVKSKGKRDGGLEGCVFPFERAAEAVRFVSRQGRTAVVRIVE